MKQFQYKKGGKWADNKLQEGGYAEAPFLQKFFEVGVRKHKTNADDREWSSSIPDKLNSVGEKARKFDGGQEDNHANKNGDDVGVGNGFFDEFFVNLVFEQINAIREESNIKSNNEATIG